MTTLTLAEAHALAERIRLDLTNAQGKLTDVLNALAAHPDAQAPRPACPTCGLKFRGPLTLAEHMHHSHQAPVPEHLLEAERRAGLWQTLDDEEPA